MENLHGEFSCLNTTDAYNGYPESDMIHVSEITGAVRTTNFSWRAPSPPRIHIPQISDDCEIQLPPYNFSSHPDELFNEVMKRITAKFQPIVPTNEWKYVWRRQAQQIIPFIYLGPSSTTRDIEFVTQEEITMLLAVRDTATAQAKLISGEKVAQSLGIDAASVDVGGLMGLIAAFPEAVNKINDHIISVYQKSGGRKLGKVLIFCESGNERSAAVVAAYLMNTFGLSMVAAIQLIQSRRFCVSFDDGFKQLLCNYMEILSAQKQVISAVPTSSNLTMAFQVYSKRKRGEIVDHETIQDDEERFSGRRSFMPFR